MSKNIAGINHALEAGAAINHQDQDGFTALMMAAKGGSKDVITCLLKSGARANPRNDIGQDALMIAAKGGHSEIARLLIDSGASVFDFDREGRSVIDWAVTGGDFPELVVFLVSKGIPVNTADNNGFSPLMRASILGRGQSTSRLLQAGADKNMTLRGKTAADMAEERGFHQLSEHIKAFRNDKS